MRLMTTGGALVAALMIGAAPAAAQTNGFVLQCFSARAAGQGCVTRGVEGAPSQLFRDPAGLLWGARGALEVNVAPFAPTLHFENGANPETRGARHVYPLASVAYTSGRRGRVAWGVGVEPIGGFGADFELQHPVLSGAAGESVGYESFFAAVKAGPTVAYELAPGLGVGASVSVVHARIGEFRMPFSMPPSAAQGLAPLAGLDPAYPALFGQITEMTAYGDSEDYAGWGWSGDLGVSYRGQAVTASASWSPKSTIRVDGGRAVIDMTAQFSQMMAALVGVRMQAYGETQADAQAAVMGQLSAAGLDLAAGMAATYEAATEISLPMTVGAGITVKPSAAWQLAAEVEWRQWSEAERTMPFELTGGDNANINLMMNADPTAGAFTYPFPLRWEDTFTGKVGVSRALAGGNALRLGYLYGENPVPDETVFVAFPAVSTQALTLGGTVVLRGLALDVALVHALDQEVSAPSVGHQVAAEYAGSRTRLQETLLTIGTVFSF